MSGLDGTGGFIIRGTARSQLTVSDGGDLNGDGTVGSADLIIIFLNWGACGELCEGDLNGDGMVDVQDLTMVLFAWE